ncbi:conserved hypothetical protein [Ricinus communis]|uniref:Uncharacterized protein n=1 Tax=Ricinus communis TaxID=3988 RepID=B9SPV4_RICCO|nr:conserved hypothetical protein [Ricinus communis]
MDLRKDEEEINWAVMWLLEERLWRRVWVRILVKLESGWSKDQQGIRINRTYGGEKISSRGAYVKEKITTRLRLRSQGWVGLGLGPAPPPPSPV